MGWKSRMEKGKEQIELVGNCIVKYGGRQPVGGREKEKDESGCLLIELLLLMHTSVVPATMHSCLGGQMST